MSKYNVLKSSEEAIAKGLNTHPKKSQSNQRIDCDFKL